MYVEVGIGEINFDCENLEVYVISLSPSNYSFL